MIQVFRSVGTKIAAGIFALLMLVFVLTSVDWNQLSTGGAVGKINGERVDARVYQTAVQQAIDNRQRQSPAGLGADDYAEIRNEVWEQFIQRASLEAEYKQRGITVSDDEVVNALRNAPLPELRSAPEFQTDSQFDPSKYQRWLTTSAAQPVIANLEGYYREQILQEKLFRAITADVFLPASAIWERYRDQQETVKIGVAAVMPQTAVPDSAVTVTPAEVDAYYKAHTDEFKRPRTAYLSYVSVPRIANTGDTAIARARADSVRQEILDGAPFAEVAQRESSDSGSAVRGGDLGEWKRGTMDAAFDSAAFALPLETVSTPVLSRYGFHLIEITSRKGDSTAGRHILIPIEIAGAHLDSLDAQADSLERIAVEQTTPAALDSAARALGLKVEKAPPVREGSRVRAGNVIVPDAGSWAFDGKAPGSTSSLIDPPWAYYVFRLDSLQDEGIPSLASIRPEVTEAARNAKKLAKARTVAESYVQRLAQGTSMEDAAKAMGLPYRELGPFSRVNPQIGSPVIVGAAFGLDAGQRSGPIETKEGIYLIQVLERTKADSTKFEEAKDVLTRQATEQARQERVRGYLEALRKSMKVVDRRNEIQQQQATAGA